MEQRKPPLQVNDYNDSERFKKGFPVSDQNRANMNPPGDVILTEINWKVNDLIDNKYSINTILHQTTSSCLKFVVTSLPLLRNLVMTVVQPSQFAVLPQLIQNINDWKVLSFHPNIVQFVGIDYAQKIPLVLTEFLPCISLKELILTKELYKTDEKTPTQKIFHICFSIARALKFAHDRSVFHLNLKPSNILQIKREPQTTETNDCFCVTDFGSVILMSVNSGCLENSNTEALAENFLFWPPFLVQLLQKWSQLKNHQDHSNELTETLKQKIDLFGFGTILLYVLVGGPTWKSSSELSSPAVSQMLKSQAVVKINPELMDSLINLIINCLAIENGFTSFDGVLANIQQIYSQYTNVLGQPSALELLDQSTIEAADKFNLTIISDSMALDNRTDPRIRYVKQELSKLQTSQPSSPQARKVQEKLLYKMSYLESILTWLRGQTFDYKLFNAYTEFPLFAAFVYDAQRNASKAIDYYREALKTVEDDRFMAILNRQQLLAREIRLDGKKRFYGHTKKNDIYRIKLTNNGTKALSFSRNDSIILWDLQNPTLPNIIDESNVVSGDITEDGSLIMLGKRDGKIVFLQQVKEQQKFERTEIQAHRNSIDTILISQNGKYALSGEAFSLEVWVWDINLKTTLGAIGVESIIKAVALDQSANLILISEMNSFNISVHEKDSRKFSFQKKDELKGHTSHISHLKMTKDAMNCKEIGVSASVDGCLIIWNLESKKFLRKIALEGLVLNLDITSMGKYIAVKTSLNKISIYEATTNMHIKSFCFKGKNSGLAIQLEDSLFDYLKQETEISFIKGWKEKKNVDVAENDYIKNSSNNFAVTCISEEERLVKVRNLLEIRNKFRAQSLVEKKDITFCLKIATGDLTERGNSLKVCSLPIPFCGINLSEAVLSHEDCHNLQGARKNFIQQIVDKLLDSYEILDIRAIFDSLQSLKLNDDIFLYPRILPIYYEVSEKLNLQKGLLWETYNIIYDKDPTNENPYEIGLQRASKPKPVLKFGDLEQINQHFWEEFVASYGLHYCPESTEDITHIYMMEFSPNDKYLFVLNRGLYAWIFETQKWEITHFVDLKGINFNKDLDSQAGQDNEEEKENEGEIGVDFVSSVSISSDGERIILGLDMGVICEVAVANGKATFVTQGHMSSVTVITPVKEPDFFLSGSLDGDIKLWQTTTPQPSFQFKKHYAAIEVIRVVATENIYSAANKIHIGSIDQNGLVLIWNLKDGEVLKMIKIQANAAYSISDTWPIKVLYSYQDEKNIYIEHINLETNEKIKIIDGIIFEDESVSPYSYRTQLGDKTNIFRKPYFFLSNLAANNYCVSNKNTRKLRFRNINFLDLEAKVDLQIPARCLKGNYSLTALIACDGLTLKIFTLENSYKDFIN